VTSHLDSKPAPVAAQAPAADEVLVEATVLETTVVDSTVIEATVLEVTAPEQADQALASPAASAAVETTVVVDGSALGSTVPDDSALDEIWPEGIAASGLVQLARAQWPGSRGDELPPVAGFVTSAFSPLVAAVADLCLLDYFGSPTASDTRGERTGIVLASSTGDLATSAAIAAAVQAGRRVPPLLFYQSNHNAVAGYVAARWGLRGPVVCTMPGGAAAADDEASPLSTALAEALASAALLIEDGDADAALVIAANAYADGGIDGTAVLIGPASWPTAAASPASVPAFPQSSQSSVH